MTPLHVVCISDGRPGHEKQSRAVISALDALTPLSVVFLKLGANEGVKRFMQGARALIMSRGEFDFPSSSQVDLVVGTGSSTHLPMIGMKLRFKAKLVTCMSPDPLLRPWFDLCLVPRHDRSSPGHKIFTTLGPPCLPMPVDRHDPKRALLLAGGVDIKSHHWDTADLMRRIKKLVSQMPDLQWTISSSPRTPADAIARLRRLADASENLAFFSADETPPGWIESAYAANHQVWVTADSVSMIYEALTAGCRVGVLPVKWKHAKNKFQAGIDDLKNRGMIVDFEQWNRGEELPKTTTPLNEAARCAKEILSRWWPERLA